jgi:2-dehydropantoate 2-reductase
MTRGASIAVIGMGGIGGVVASCLRLSARHRIVACARNRFQEVVLEQPEGTRHLTLDVLTDPFHADCVDWVLLCTKAQDTASTSDWFARLCGPTTCVAVLQNGIGHEQRVAPYAGNRPIVPAIVYLNAERRAVNHFRFRNAAGEDIATPDTPSGRAFARLFEGTSLKVAPRRDFLVLLWTKLLLNAAANPITALTRQRLAVLQRADMQTLALEIIREGASVARAVGVDFGENIPSQVMAKLLTYPPSEATSMYFDCLNGRALELEALTGSIVRMGQQLSVPTPVNQTLLTLLQAISDAPMQHAPR